APLGVELKLHGLDSYDSGDSDVIEVEVKVGTNNPTCGSVKLAPGGEFYDAMAQLDRLLAPYVRIYAFRNFGDGWVSHAVLRAADWEGARGWLGPHFDLIFFPPSQIPDEYRRVGGGED